MTEIALRNVRLLVAYDGTDFHGFAESAGMRTVMGELTQAVSTVLRHPVEFTGAGRTDAGVHAWGQVVTGLVPEAADLDRLVRSINRMLAPAIAVREAAFAADDFSARFSATSRSYRYDVWSDPAPNPLLARRVWHVPVPLDVDLMNDEAAALVGTHDFSSFCRAPKPPPGRPPASLVRIVTHASWQHVDTSLLRFEISATSFCHQMVRSIVGTLVDVGRGRRSAGSTASALAAFDRTAAGPVAPPTGLVLWHVGFDGERWDA